MVGLEVIVTRDIVNTYNEIIIKANSRVRVERVNKDGYILVRDKDSETSLVNITEISIPNKINMVDIPDFPYILEKYLQNNPNIKAPKRKYSWYKLLYILNKIEEINESLY